MDGPRDYHSKQSKSEKDTDFPGDPAAKTPFSQCRSLGFNPWLGNWIPHAATESSHTSTTRILHATVRTWHSQVNNFF